MSALQAACLPPICPFCPNHPGLHPARPPRLPRHALHAEGEQGGDECSARRLVTPPETAKARRSNMRAAQSRADSVSFSNEELRADPGVYLITVVSEANVESDFALEVHRAAGSAAPPLAPEDQAALEAVRP